MRTRLAREVQHAGAQGRAIGNGRVDGMQWQHEWIASLTWIARTYSMACQRFGLLGLDLDATFLIGTHPQYGAYMAGNIQVTPGNPLTIAVSRLSPTVVPAEHGGVVCSTM